MTPEERKREKDLFNNDLPSPNTEYSPLYKTFLDTIFYNADFCEMVQNITHIESQTNEVKNGYYRITAKCRYFHDSEFKDGEITIDISSLPSSRSVQFWLSTYQDDINMNDIYSPDIKANIIPYDRVCHTIFTFLPDEKQIIMQDTNEIYGIDEHNYIGFDSFDFNKKTQQNPNQNTDRNLIAKNKSKTNNNTLRYQYIKFPHQTGFGKSFHQCTTKIFNDKNILYCVDFHQLIHSPNNYVVKKFALTRTPNGHFEIAKHQMTHYKSDNERIKGKTLVRGDLAEVKCIEEASQLFEKRCKKEYRAGNSTLAEKKDGIATKKAVKYKQKEKTKVAKAQNKHTRTPRNQNRRHQIALGKYKDESVLDKPIPRLAAQQNTNKNTAPVSERFDYGIRKQFVKKCGETMTLDSRKTLKEIAEEKKLNESQVSQTNSRFDYTAKNSYLKKAVESDMEK